MPTEVFISYARRDNQATGWVTTFCSELKNRLAEVHSRPVNVYFDDANVDGNPLAAIPKTHLEQAQILVCVITPSFPGREWTKNEMGHFLKGRAKPVIFRAAKLPCSVEEAGELPEPVRQVPDIQFWGPGPAPNNYPLEFVPQSLEYRSAINDLAHGIKNRLVAIQRQRRGRTVYVARPDAEL